MGRGDFAAAWQLADAAVRPRGEAINASEPRHLQRVWTGDAVAGRRVLVHCYHGLGDTVQFARFIPRLTAVARGVDVWMQPPLIAAYGDRLAPARLLPLDDGPPPSGYEVDVEIMELAHVFRIELRHMPPPLAIRDWRGSGPSGGVVEIGLAWRAGNWNPGRSMSLADLAPVLAVPHARTQPLLASLDVGEAACFPAWTPQTTVAGLADLVAALDVVVTVDTLAAHLAGSIGVPTWLLLHDRPDWRWMDTRADTPWYPSMRIARRRPGERWIDVTTRVADAIARERALQQ